MTDTLPFAEDLLLAAAAGLVVLFAPLVSQRVRIPSSMLILAASAIAIAVAPISHRPTPAAVGRVVTVALVTVLFAGGMGLGARRVRAAATPIVTLGVLGTFGTAAGAAAFLHFAFRWDWYVSLLVATAVAPTDPAVVFSLLGRGRIAGRSATILQGESGANDPVGIALMAALIGARGLSAGGAVHALGTFALQMVVGGATGVAGGRVLLWLTRRVPLPGHSLDPIRTLASAFALYGVATVAHGSGFLAVFTAGIVIGDAAGAHMPEVRDFHSALASLGEMTAFVALGLTVDLPVLGRADVWGPGIALGAALALLVRPAVVRACLVAVPLPPGERRFVQFTGLKGAVPILLGGYLFGAGLAGPARYYGIVIVVVVFSVVVQGSLVGPVLSRLHLPAED